MDKGQQQILRNLLSSIRAKFNKKNELRKEMTDIRGKILIEKQIMEELKRKLEENGEHYKEQLREMEENMDNKEEYMKIFEKKLKEVEIYVHKHTKNLKDNKYEVYKDFKMSEFIAFNTEFVRTKDIIWREICKIRKQIDEIKIENQNYQQEMKELNNIQESNNNIKNMFKFYKNQIKLLDMRNRRLKSFFGEMTSKLKYLNPENCK